MNEHRRSKPFSRRAGLSVGLCLSIALLASPGRAASLKEITGFGNNPSNIKMYLYVPDKVQAHPPILVGMHWCHGTGPAFYSGTGFAALADKYGFILICPNANSSDSCWDVHSNAVLTHNGGGDASGIISMVQYVVKNYHADSTRVYATGHSSGAMMTNVMLGSYPDVFKAGAAFAGVPFSCFSGTNSWNSDCAGGKITKTGAAWGDAVRAAYPGYTGPRPRMQLWHGDQDAILNFNNFGEEIKEWTNVLGVSSTPTTTENNQPQSTWVRTRYTNGSGVVEVEAIKETGQPHNLQIVADKAVTFLTLDVATTGLGEAKLHRADGAAELEVLQGARGLRVELNSLPGRVRLDLYDLRGAKIRTLADQDSPLGTVQIDLERVGPGVYVIAAQLDGHTVGSTRFAVLNP